MGTKVFEQSNLITDLNTGEVIKSEHIIKRQIDRESFIQVYLEDLSGLFQIETKTELKLIGILWRESEYKSKHIEGNRVIIVKGLKQEWAEEIGVNPQTISNTITSLAKKNLIIQKDRTIYYLNPKYFFKGALNDRNSTIKTVLEYTFNEKEDKKIKKIS